MKLRQILLMGLCATLVIGLTGTESGALTPDSETRSRTVRVPYLGPAVAVSTPATLVTLNCGPEVGRGCVTIPVGPKDRFVKLRIDDLSGQDVFAMVLDQSDSELAFFCGKTRSKLPVFPRSSIEVWLIAGTCFGTTRPSIVTSGEVVATFSGTR